MTVIKAGSAKTEHSKAGDPLGPYSADLISDTAALTQFGAFVEEIPPGSSSSFAHWHEAEDEMVFVLSGEVTVYEDGVPTIITAGDAACWKAGTQVSHCMYNHSDAAARYIVIGTRARADVVTYPSHDRKLYFDRDSNTRRYTTLDGAPADAP